jgi:hypothetical protein
MRALLTPMLENSRLMRTLVDVFFGELSSQVVADPLTGDYVSSHLHVAPRLWLEVSAFHVMSHVFQPLVDKCIV